MRCGGAAGEGATLPCEPRNLGFEHKAAGWTHLPLSKLKRDTVYTLISDAGRSGVLRANADRSASLFVAALKPAIRAPMTLSWDWKTDALVAGADNRDKAREDAPLRVLVAFDGDVATLAGGGAEAVQAGQDLVGRAPRRTPC